MIRPAHADDHEAIAILFGELGVPEPPPTRDQWLGELVADTIVYARGSDVVGYVRGHALPYAGHVHNIVVAPAARRGGIGRALMLAAAARFRERGLVEWHLNVKADNVPAIRLYEQLGMTARYDTTLVAIAWDALPDEHDAPVASPIDSARDTELERAFGLLCGRIARTRSRAARVQLELREHGAPVGIGVFDPSFGGFSPVVLRRPTLAAALARAARPFARPDESAVKLAVEGDATLAAALLAAGGTAELALVHYAGAVPAS